MKRTLQIFVTLLSLCLSFSFESHHQTFQEALDYYPQYETYNPVPVSVPEPVPVPVVSHEAVPYPVSVPEPVPVQVVTHQAAPYPVPVSEPVPVPVVTHQINYPVPVPEPVAVPVVTHQIDRYPVAVPEPVPVPVVSHQIDRYPVPVAVPEPVPVSVAHYVSDYVPTYSHDWVPDWISDKYPYPEQYPYSQYYPDYAYYPPQVAEVGYRVAPRVDVPAYTEVESPEVFPKGFSFGVASGSYHIEGAWTQDYKSESIWDRWLHTYPGLVVDGSNGDTSADAYNHIKEDVEILNNLTARHSKFSIPWSGVMFDGCGAINQARIDQYKRLIKLMKLNQIEPIVTLYDGDLPQALQDQGGFLSPSFKDWFTNYANVLFECLGDDVKYWITFNDPTRICKDGYGDGTFAPGIRDGPGNNEYICGHNLLLAHASVYHLYDDYYRNSQKGKISIALESDWYHPTSSCETDEYASETKLQFQIGWWAHPIYIGDYPPRMIERVRGYYDGYYPSSFRLPLFTQPEIDYIRNTHDFFALNYDSAYYVTLAGEGYFRSPCYEFDIGVQTTTCDAELVTTGIRYLIRWIQKNYYNPSIFITGHGYGTYSRDCNDDDRINWIKATLRNVRAAMMEDDARVYGYSYYSYIDGFEWLAGYTIKYGLYDVEFNSPLRTRTARKSAAYFQHLATTGCINEQCPINYYEYHY
ncbi:myrosinase 1-like [Diorhabda carinulata]|uniref:myrosinase 1-like n=1 Tax=Diorhabda carinulata TaxID=1163345 RepID=UPI0025A22180|nr:myrosinase 1-like [Diorhabda carinulata]